MSNKKGANTWLNRTGIASKIYTWICIWLDYAAILSEKKGTGIFLEGFINLEYFVIINIDDQQ